MTVAQLKTSLDDDELAHWMAYDRLDPIGGYRMDANFASIAQILRKAHLDQNHSTSDLLLFDPDPVSDEELERRERKAERQARIAHAERMKAKIAKMLEKQSSKKPLPE